MPNDRRNRALILCVGLAAAPVAPLAAQTDSATVAAGARYAADGPVRWLLGSDYRDLWTTPIRVPVLDPDTFAGGLTAVERGGGKQTISLRLLDRRGVEYVFRSVDKDQTGGLPADFQETLVDRIAQDQVSSKHPAAAIVAAPLLEAAGVLHATPRLYVMPDHPFLGEFREEFAGMLGILEIRPNEVEGEPRLNFAGAVRVAGTETLLEHLEEDAGHRIDAPAYLRARLVDLFLGDWDRHPDQWRWARFDSAGVHWWRPIPRDRDNAFSNYDGALMKLVRPGAPMLVEFGSRYPDVYGLIANASPLDRRLLAELPREAFDTTAADLQRRLTDEAIADAVARTPPEYAALRGDELALRLRARRDALPRAARAFYGRLADQVEIHATDLDERAEVERFADGSVEVRVQAAEPGADPAPGFRRRFHPDQTREIRLYLHGGDDVAVVRGQAARSIRVRIVGGGGDDRLADASRVGGRGRRTAFYDHRGDNHLAPGGEATVDRRDYDPPGSGAGAVVNNLPPVRDWGSARTWFEPHAEWRYNVGPVVGGGPVYTRYGFRQTPFAYRIGGRALYAPLETRFAVELAGDFRRVGSASRLDARAAATQLEVLRFHGLGNETPRGGADDRYKIEQTEYRLEATYAAALGEGAELFAGPILRFTDPEVPTGNPAEADRPFGGEAFGQAGGRVGLRLDTRDAAPYPRRGLRAEVAATGFPAAWDAPDAFGGAEGRVSAYLPVPLPLETTLAARAGARAALGAFPIQQAAFVGGSGSLRGFARQRYAGESALFGGAELRTFLTRFNFISRGDLGAIALVDAGRVYADGESSDIWHTAWGGGFWVGILDRTRTFHVVLARGEETAAYFGFGMPF